MYSMFLAEIVSPLTNLKQMVFIELKHFLERSNVDLKNGNEPCHEKTNILHMRKQRRRSASR